MLTTRDIQRTVTVKEYGKAALVGELTFCGKSVYEITISRRNPETKRMRRQKKYIPIDNVEWARRGTR